MALERSRLVAGLSVAAFCSFLAAISLWIFWDNIANHKEAISSGRQLIAIGGAHGYLPGAIIGLVGIATVIVYTIIAIAFDGSVDEVMGRGQRISVPIILVSLVATFAGRHLVQSYWEGAASRAGYTECAPTSLILSRATYTAWVKSPALCYDRDVRKIIMTGSKNESEQLEAKLGLRAR
jgi:hypothetical protein